MPSFLNLNFEKSFNKKLFLKHSLFSFFWILGILIFVFRLDVIIAYKYPRFSKWPNIFVPILYLGFLALYFLNLKWYWKIAFIFYPTLWIFWFLPKTILSIGKIYLFGNYLSSVVSMLVKYKLIIFKIFLLFITLIFLFAFGTNWSRWLSIFVACFYYFNYFGRYLKKSFKPPAFFGSFVEEKIKQFIENNSPENSLVIKSYVIQKNDEKLEEIERRHSQLTRTILAAYALDLFSEKLQAFRTKQSFLVSIIFSALVFFGISIVFFWFINVQIYKVNFSNFEYHGHFVAFDFLYYTLKTITFSNIDQLKPVSVISKISEVSSFMIIGIFALVFVVSIVLSLKQEKLNEDMKLTTAIFKSENNTVKKFMKETFGMDLKIAMKEIENIDTSLKNLKQFIDKIF